MAIRLSHFTMSSALGAGLAPTLAALQARRSGIVRQRWETLDFDACIGEVQGLDTITLPPALQHFDCRNNRLALQALGCDGFAEAVREAIARYGRSRVAVLLGTSTSGILSSEIAYRHRDPASGARGHRASGRVQGGRERWRAVVQQGDDAFRHAWILPERAGPAPWHCLRPCWMRW